MFMMTSRGRLVANRNCIEVWPTTSVNTFLMGFWSQLLVSCFIEWSVDLFLWNIVTFRQKQTKKQGLLWGMGLQNPSVSLSQPPLTSTNNFTNKWATPIFSMQAIVSPGLTFIKERGMTKPLSALRRQHYQRSHVCLLHKNSTARVFPLYIFLPFSLCIFLTQRYFLLLSHFKELHNAWWNKNKRFSADEVTPRLGLLWAPLGFLGPFYLWAAQP